MKYKLAFLFCVLLLLSSNLIKAQEDQGDIQKDNFIEQRVEQISENSDNPDIDYSNLLEDLQYFRKNPINLNYTKAEDLQALTILTEVQIISLLRHIERTGKLVAIYELQAVENFTLEDINKIRPFVYVSNNLESPNLSLNNILNNGSAYLVTRVSFTGEKQKGFNDVSDSILAINPNAKYLGSKYGSFSRFRYTYGNNLSLGTGWTWTFDVTDYRTLLSDSVHLSAGNWQELLDMKFEIIKGTPPRNIIGIQTIYSGGYDYGNANDPIDNYLLPVTVNIPANAVTARWKSRITGHGMDTPENCAEFCPKNHYFKVNGTQQFSKLVWRDNCDVNPLYPQGGTWVYDRSNWCPGAEVWTYDFELTPFVTPGSAAVLDHDVQPYSSTGGWHYYQIEDQIVTYGAPNFTNDASLEAILSPSSDQMYQRFNTICTHPKIKIKNNGSTNLTALTITYGMNGATPSVFNWTGLLKFEEITEVTLGNLNWAQGATYFTVTLSNPNGVADEYAPNNSRISKYNYPPVMPANFIVTCKTNARPWETEYSLKDAAGNIIFERNSLVANTIYRDTLLLAQGCYEFRLLDSGEDGLTFWANTAQGAGYARFNNMNGSVLKTFGADFGGEIYQQFTVGLNSALKEYVFEKNQVLRAFPNPTNGLLYVSLDLPKRSNGTLIIIDIIGNIVYTENINNKIADSFEIDMARFSSGVYQVILNTDSGVSSQKIILEK